ncbi:MAG: preprotein translocase subunit YajC [Bacteroidales bacterium]|nr:preprotein translocase subunit YajC [Bacteroidales bacterium]
MINVLQAAGAAPAAGGSAMTWLMLILIIVVMWFFMIRPQRKQQKELQAFRNALKKGDKVVTVGGIFGTIAEVKDDYLILEVDKDVKIRVAKSSVVRDTTETQQ